MKIKQLSVFVENRAGRLADVATRLGEARINIRALSVADTADFGILRLIVDDVDRARQLLAEAGYTVTLTDVLAIQVADQPGGLAAVLRALEEAGLNVEYLYAFVPRTAGQAVVVFRFDDPERAVAVFSQLDLQAIPAEQLLRL
ncbi:MAG: ACT domain-containing protein [Candidatus Marinimicrobia bacterium]|nr:ACT domain-containing protein [Candidatus Neomarinimicrobiota bacterium]